MFEKLKKFFKKRDLTTQNGLIEFLKESQRELKINDVVISPRILGEHNIRYLTYIDLSYLNLKDIPKPIFELYNLKSINLRGNLLTSFNDNLTRLENLEYLDMRDNKIEVIPPFVSLMPSIHNLGNIEGNWIDGNPINEPPYEVAAQGMKSIKEYYQDIDKI